MRARALANYAMFCGPCGRGMGGRKVAMIKKFCAAVADVDLLSVEASNETIWLMLSHARNALSQYQVYAMCHNSLTSGSVRTRTGTRTHTYTAACTLNRNENV